MIVKHAYALIFIALALLVPIVGPTACAASATGPVRDYWPTGTWVQLPPHYVGMNENRLNSMFASIAVQSYSIDSVLIVHNGYLVVEEYLNPAYNETTWHEIYSCTKSVISALVGVAIEEGRIAGVEEKVLSFFPNMTIANPDPRKDNITIEHLLTMTSGLEWHEFDVSYGSPSNDFNLMSNSADWVQYVLDRPMDQDPGEVWNYNSGTTHLLSAILQNATGTSPEEYFEFISTRLGEPIGAGDIDWETDPQGVLFGGSGIKAYPRDLAKFGFLYLNNGSWDGEQVIPDSWVNASSTGHVSTGSGAQYGYQWWVYPEIGMYTALGYGGQHIMVVPEHDLVVVFTASIQDSSWPFPGLVADYIIPAVEDGPVMAHPPISPLLLPSTAMLTVLIVVVVIGWDKVKRGRESERFRMD
ncbi:MAG: serine hydrolase [Candidatus Thorarchaeota archaeon]|nr:MAG: serine hydrolase [Candidatus Thorarchaeota archaeon]